MQDIKERVSFSKRWAELKTFDKDLEKYTRGLENKISELTEREARLVSLLKQVVKNEDEHVTVDDYDLHMTNLTGDIREALQSLGLQE